MMRTKEQILNDTVKPAPHVPQWSTTTSTNEPLIIEVLIDIRDILETWLVSLDNTILKCLIKN